MIITGGKSFNKINNQERFKRISNGFATDFQLPGNILSKYQ